MATKKGGKKSAAKKGGAKKGAKEGRNQEGRKEEIGRTSRSQQQRSAWRTPTSDGPQGLSKRNDEYFNEVRRSFCF